MKLLLGQILVQTFFRMDMFELYIGKAALLLKCSQVVEYELGSLESL